MINFFSENIAAPTLSEKTENWLRQLIENEGKKVGKIDFIFCDDEYLLEINRTYLKHDYYTDIITFDYVKGKIINGDIFISLQRVQNNAETLQVETETELNRVLAHGILHLCGYADKTEEEQLEMRSKEDFYLQKF